jgi:hypothetical protein
MEQIRQKKHKGKSKGDKGNAPQNQRGTARLPNKDKAQGQLKEIPFVDQTLTKIPAGQNKTKRKAFKEHRAAFLQALATHLEPELRKAGLNDRQIETMQAGRTPEGYNTHHKKQLSGGGENKFDNFVFIDKRPHEKIHQFIDPQLAGMSNGETRTVKAPVPTGSIYIPHGGQIHQARLPEKVIAASQNLSPAEVGGDAKKKSVVATAVMAQMAAGKGAAR